MRKKVCPESHFLWQIQWITVVFIWILFSLNDLHFNLSNRIPGKAIRLFSKNSLCCSHHASVQYLTEQNFVERGETERPIKNYFQARFFRREKRYSLTKGNFHWVVFLRCQFAVTMKWLIKKEWRTVFIVSFLFLWLIVIHDCFNWWARYLKEPLK